MQRYALITGAARRIGATIAERLHGADFNVAIHYRGSVDEAQALVDNLNRQRENSARSFQADLLADGAPDKLVADVCDWGGRLDLLVNNASGFYPTPIGKITESDWNELTGSNLKAPLFLSQAAAPHLRASSGNIVNIVDIHAMRPLRDHSVYSAAKAGLIMLTRSMAKDLAPEVRVNGVAPGAIIWPEDGMTEKVKDSILAQIPMRRQGGPEDIANAVLFLSDQASYITGQIVAVDGGRSLVP